MSKDSSSALLTDHYELTMLQGALHSGAGARRSVFEMFARRLPEGRRYGVVAGTGRFLDLVERFRFRTEELDFLSDNGVVDERTLNWLADYRFSGNVWGYGEGETYFPGSPVLVVEASFAEAVVLETLALSVFNHDSAIASAATRMAVAAGDRPLIEMGSRRTHEQAAASAARAAYVSGFADSSNLEAGRAYGVPTSGTASHAFTLLHDDEEHAFKAQLESMGTGTTLLVDTFDVETAVHNAVELAGTKLGAVRIDSGDLGAHAVRVRAQLDSLGATNTRIVVTGDLDEHAIQALAVAPVDGYGVGTSLVMGSGAPTVSLVYKLVARARELGSDAPLEPVAKRSVGKPSRGGRKWSLRRLDEKGFAVAEEVFPQEPTAEAGTRPLLRPLITGGEVVGHESVHSARERHTAAVAELPEQALRMSRGDPALPTVFQ